MLGCGNRTDHHPQVGKLPRQLKELTATKAERVVSGIYRRGDEDAVRHIIEP